MPAPRRLRTAVSALALACVVPGSPAATADPKPGGFMSPNVTWVATLALDAPAIGGRVVTVGGQRRFYVTDSHGLTIYDVTNPALPLPLGALALPHFENESAAVSDDGSVVFLASDPSFGQPSVTYVVDTSLVNAPHVASVIPDGSHTATCSDAKCSYLYGSYGYVYDVRDRANPKLTNGFAGGGFTHYASRDAAGLLWDNRRYIDPRKDPLHPYVGKVGTGGWHNNLRPNAERWRPRKPSDKSPYLKPGELVVGGDETWLSPGKCSASSAAVSSWNIVNFDRGWRAVKVDSIVPVNGSYDDGNPAVDAVGCSSHWFDYRKGMVAAGWYDHGVKFVKVDERTGKLALAGWFQPVNTMAWGAYWMDDQYVYSVDAARGIDILRFDRSAPLVPTRAPAPKVRTVPLTAFVRRAVYVCRPR